MSVDVLLAKSVPLGAKPSRLHELQGHTAYVVSSAQRLLAVRGKESLAAAGLDPDLLSRLSRIVLLGAFAHDLGKCSDHFQAMVRKQREVPQLIRHEAATLWLAWPDRVLGPFFESAAGSRQDLILALCAAAGHHRKFWSRACAGDGDGAGTKMTLLSGHPDFLRLIGRAGAMTGLPFGDVPALANVTIECNRKSSPEETLSAWQEEAEAIARKEPRLLAIAKAWILNADIAGSALPKDGEKPSWIDEAITIRPDATRLSAVVQHRLSGRPLRPFQQSVARSSAPVTLVRAGCGTGKTAAAYAWAASLADSLDGQQESSFRQLWVTYPTTGTATEGFRDYVHQDNVDLHARLEHGRAEVDLDILGLREDDDGTRDRDRLDALRAWQQEAIVCTVDTVLGLIQNQRKGLYAWAGLAHAAIVFDEIHAYDDALFGALLRFLEALPGTPVLLMTASLPADRLRALQRLIERVHGRPLPILDGPPEIEALPRYLQIQSQDPWSDIERCLRCGGEGGRPGKVLWVSNVVQTALDRALEAKRRGLECLVYHSRFRYRDRVESHGRVIDAFQTSNSRPAFAITTQVAEMSLDLSADLLVSDIAPVPALIQRLGRLNRRSTPENPQAPKPALFLEVGSPLPYDETQISEARQWLRRLGSGPFSQQDLVRSWTPEEGPEQRVTPSAWLDGGFRTEPGPLRESEIGISVLLGEDAAKVRRKELRAVEVALPMNNPPSRLKWMTWPRVDAYPVPPDGCLEYDPILGGKWI